MPRNDDTVPEPSHRPERNPRNRRATAYVAVLAVALAVLATCGTDYAHSELVAKLRAGDYSRRGADTCLGCHDEEEPFPTLEVFKTVHGDPSVPGSPFHMVRSATPPAGLQCEACHGPAGDHAASILAIGASRQPMVNFGRRGNLDAAVQNGLCLACHATYERARWSGSAHEEAQLACADCHIIHNAVDDVRARDGQAATCTACHRNVAADALKRSSHPMRGNQLVCRDCHDPHGGGEALSVHATLGETCLACHADLRGPFLWEHAPVVEDCTICHVAHGSNQPALLVRRAPQLCQGCHSSIGHRSFAQTAADLASERASAFLLANACLNCHFAVHGSNHPSGNLFRR